MDPPRLGLVGDPIDSVLDLLSLALVGDRAPTILARARTILALAMVLVRTIRVLAMALACTIRVLAGIIRALGRAILVPGTWHTMANEITQIGNHNA